MSTEGAALGSPLQNRNPAYAGPDSSQPAYRLLSPPNNECKPRSMAKERNKLPAPAAASTSKNSPDQDDSDGPLADPDEDTKPDLDHDDNSVDQCFSCTHCDKVYTGKHARSIWRRHLQDKHHIPLASQPRKTRWDNVNDRPRSEEERRQRTLESKRRWARKNRADKKAGRPSDHDPFNESSTASYQSNSSLIDSPMAGPSPSTSRISQEGDQSQLSAASLLTAVKDEGDATQSQAPPGQSLEGANKPQLSPVNARLGYSSTPSGTTYPRAGPSPFHEGQSLLQTTNGAAASQAPPMHIPSRVSLPRTFQVPAYSPQAAAGRRIASAPVNVVPSHAINISPSSSQALAPSAIPKQANSSTAPNGQTVVEKEEAAMQLLALSGSPSPPAANRRQAATSPKLGNDQLTAGVHRQLWPQHPGKKRPAAAQKSTAGSPAGSPLKRSRLSVEHLAEEGDGSTTEQQGPEASTSSAPLHQASKTSESQPTHAYAPDGTDGSSMRQRGHTVSCSSPSAQEAELRHQRSLSAPEAKDTFAPSTHQSPGPSQNEALQADNGTKQHDLSPGLILSSPERPGISQHLGLTADSYHSNGVGISSALPTKSGYL